jgi:hypothetical protein
MIPHDEFPRLTEASHRVTSPETKDYNCIAWAARDTANWWQPGVYWPIPVDPEDADISALQLAFESLCFGPCNSADLEPGIEKVALYSAGRFYTHAARQTANGPANSARGWTSNTIPPTTLLVESTETWRNSCSELWGSEWSDSHRMILVKDKRGRVIGFERLEFLTRKQRKDGGDPRLECMWSSTAKWCSTPASTRKRGPGQRCGWGIRIVSAAKTTSNAFFRRKPLACHA